MYTQEGISGIPGLLTKDSFFGFFKVEGKASLVAGGRYRPLSLITFAIEQEIFGDNATIRHIINALFYTLLCILIYLITIKAFNHTSLKKNLPLFALVTALIFAFHPIHTEAVANIKGRDEIMTFLFALGTLWAALRYLKTQQILFVVLGAVFFGLALLSKENAITFLAVIPLAYWVFTKARLRNFFEWSSAIFTPCRFKAG